MATKWTDIIDPIIADTFYVDGQLVARNVEIVLPGFNRTTVTNDSLGMDIPLSGQYDNSNMQVHIMGVNHNLAYACRAGVHEYEARYVQDKIDFEGNANPVGGYCWVRGRSLGLPEQTINKANSTDNTVEIIPLACKNVVDGVTICDIDKLNGVAIIGGVDEAQDIEAML